MQYHILIAEDEEVLRKNLSYILTSHGYAVTGAKTLDGAIDVLKSRKIDLVITDLMMPRGSGGMDLIAYIFRDMPGLPVIIITAYPSIDSTVEAIRKGVLDYFTKPFEIEDLLASVKKGLEKNAHEVFYWDRIKPWKITPREMNILKLMIESGCTKNQEIAGALCIKESTAKQYLDSLYNKFGVNNRAALVSAVMKMIS